MTQGSSPLETSQTMDTSTGKPAFGVRPAPLEFVFSLAAQNKPKSLLLVCFDPHVHVLGEETAVQDGSLTVLFFGKIRGCRPFVGSKATPITRCECAVSWVSNYKHWL